MWRLSWPNTISNYKYVIEEGAGKGAGPLDRCSWGSTPLQVRCVVWPLQHHVLDTIGGARLQVVQDYRWWCGSSAYAQANYNYYFANVVLPVVCYAAHVQQAALTMAVD